MGVLVSGNSEENGLKIDRKGLEVSKAEKWLAPALNYEVR